MTGDQLSDVFDLVQIRSVLSGGFSARGAWVSGGRIDTPIKFFAMVRGRARLATDGVPEPVPLEPGDVVVLNDRSWIELSGGAGEGPPREVVPAEGFGGLVGVHTGGGQDRDDVMVGGRVDLDPAGRALLAPVLPPVAHVRAAAAGAAHLRGTLDRLLEEASAGRAGSAFAIRQYGQLLLLDVLRAFLDQAAVPPGWLRLLVDERLRPALALMHAQPGRPWGLAELAAAASMSRTSFAERFRAVAGVPPLAYLQSWRMLLARRALRDEGVRVGELARRLGYASESAFSTAFKREVGESPLRYRRREEELAAAGQAAARYGRKKSRSSAA